MAATISFTDTNGQSIEIEDNPLSALDTQIVFENISAKDAAVFEEKRIQYLQQAYNVLTKFRWILGTSQRGSRRLSLWLKPNPIISIINPSGDLYEIGRSADRTARFGNNAIRERLEFINRELWLHAPIVIRSNEFGGIFAIAPNGGAAIGSKGFYRSASLGLAISYNPKASFVRVEVFYDYEKLLSGIPGQVNAGVTFKFGGFIANRLDAGETEEHPFANARSSYPLGPFALEDSSSHLGIGLPVMLGVVPSPLDGFMGVQNSTTRKILRSRKFQCSSLATD
ncbi:MAG: hypothetical protein K2X47_09015 [Bdellovibrionales bacterium]|nr:hypothetical protein [Bdellovibrionales bacterium]